FSLPAEDLARKVRAFNPFPGANGVVEGVAVKFWFAEPVAGSGAPGQVLQADADGIVVACGRGALRVIELQKPGGKRLKAVE
ncbi:methionyl-tRNA formyltransferase, partial [Acinetobacter baumannii]|nr:methionyl-tRNA formyltransferase [Acinetobacter baumannii]